MRSIAQYRNIVILNPISNDFQHCTWRPTTTGQRRRRQAKPARRAGKGAEQQRPADEGQRRAPRGHGREAQAGERHGAAAAAQSPHPRAGANRRDKAGWGDVCVYVCFWVCCRELSLWVGVRWFRCTRIWSQLVGQKVKSRTPVGCAEVTSACVLSRTEPNQSKSKHTNKNQTERNGTERKGTKCKKKLY